MTMESQAEPRSGSAAQTGPRHVAIIMDGNGRWAQARGLPRSEGHRRGVDAVRRAVHAAGQLGVSHLTLYGFSSENWRRPPDEVAFLMGLIRRFIQHQLAELHAGNVRIRVIGTMAGVEADIVHLIEDAVRLTAGNDGLALTVAFNYGARDELARAAARLARDVACGRLAPDAIGEGTLAERLDTSDLPDPDLLIRTGGEQRLSNFLLWQSAYTELVFVDIAWPEFCFDTLATAVSQFRARERRYGGIGARASA